MSTLDCLQCSPMTSLTSSALKFSPLSLALLCSIPLKLMYSLDAADLHLPYELLIWAKLPANTTGLPWSFIDASSSFPLSTEAGLSFSWHYITLHAIPSRNSLVYTLSIFVSTLIANRLAFRLSTVFFCMQLDWSDFMISQSLSCKMLTILLLRAHISVSNHFLNEHRFFLLYPKWDTPQFCLNPSSTNNMWRTHLCLATNFQFPWFFNCATLAIHWLYTRTRLIVSWMYFEVL